MATSSDSSPTVSSHCDGDNDEIVAVGNDAIAVSQQGEDKEPPKEIEAALVAENEAPTQASRDSPKNLKKRIRESKTIRARLLLRVKLTGGRVIDPFRSSLTPKSVEALICLQDWIKKRDQSDIEYYPSLEELEFNKKMERDVAKGKAVLVESDEEEPTSKAGTLSSKSAKVSKRSAAATPTTNAAARTSKSAKAAEQGLLPPRKAKGKKN